MSLTRGNGGGRTTHHYECNPRMQRRLWNHRPIPERRFVPLCLNTIVDLIERQGYCHKAENGMEVVLRRTSSAHERRGLEKVDDDAEN